MSINLRFKKISIPRIFKFLNGFYVQDIKINVKIYVIIKIYGTKLRYFLNDIQKQ